MRRQLIIAAVIAYVLALSASLNAPANAQISIGGRDQLTNPVVSGQISIADGTVADPSIVFSSDDDGTGTGIYRVVANQIGFATNGSSRFRVNSSGIRVTKGVVSDPGIAAITDENTGIYWSDDDSIGFTHAGKDGGHWYVATGTLTATQVRKLSATPIEVVVAPGSGKAIVVESIQYMFDYGGTVYDNVGAGENLYVGQVTAGNRMVNDCASTSSCINSGGTSDDYGSVEATTQVTMVPLSDNDGIDITILNGEWASTDDDSAGNSPLHYLIRYRVLTLDLS